MNLHARRRSIAAVALLVLSALVVSTARAQDQPKASGVLKVAMIGEPPTLDLHTTTATIVQQITWHVYEGLYTYDRTYSAIPLLVEGHAVSDSGKTYTFRLRRGVKFHNGKELTSADVVPSLQRWGRLATPGKQFWKNVEGVEAKDPYTEAALDMQEIMAAGFGDKAFYRLDPGLSFPEQPQWHSRAGGEDRKSTRLNSSHE